LYWNLTNNFVQKIKDHLALIAAPQDVLPGSGFTSGTTKRRVATWMNTTRRPLLLHYGAKTERDITWPIEQTWLRRAAHAERYLASSTTVRYQEKLDKKLSVLYL
jgi:hypothetical protein